MIRTSRTPGRAFALVGFTCFAASAFPVVVMDFDTLYTGVMPGGTPPWATLTIQNSGVNTVTMTLAHNPTSAAGQFLSRLFLNIDPYPNNLTFTPVSGPISSHQFSQDGVNLVGGPYDFAVYFVLAPPANRLLPGVSATWQVSGTGLDENSFWTTSPGGVIAMLHIQGIGPNGEDSGHVTLVPEPASLLAIGVGLAALAMRRKRKA